MDDRTLFTTGVEIKQLQFDNFWDWFIHFSDIKYHWESKPTYLISQIGYIIGGILTLIHALAKGGRLPYLWIGIVLHGLVIESITYVHPDVDNFWHSQTPVILLGRRLPVHIILLYPCFIYQAAVAASKLNLPKWSHPFAVGLLSVLIDIPYDIISVRYIHWTWHDTDPNIGDRHYWVPWNSYFFHATFAAGFIFWFHFLREKICNNTERWSKDTVTKELFCTILSVLLGSPTGLLFFIGIYHPLKDVYKIHSEVTFFIIFAVFLLLSWMGDRSSVKPSNLSMNRKVDWTTWLLLVHLIAHYLINLFIPILFNPEDEVTTGLREPIGPCDQYTPLNTVAGITLQKRKFLCTEDFDEQYFDFNCLKRPPTHGSIWYTVCGVKFENRAEYIVILALIGFVAAAIFANLHFKSYGDAVFEPKVNVPRNTKNIVKKKK